MTISIYICVTPMLRGDGGGDDCDDVDVEEEEVVEV